MNYLNYLCITPELEKSGVSVVLHSKKEVKKVEKKETKQQKQTRENKTTILVAHRISTVKDMDIIVLIDEGKIIACGKHDELLKTSDVYKEMVLLQQLDEEEVSSHE